MNGTLCLAFDDQCARAALCDVAGGEWRLAAWLQEHEQRADPAASGFLTDRVTAALRELGRALGCHLQWSGSSSGGAGDGPAYRLGALHLTGCLTPPLRVWLLTPTPLHWLTLQQTIHGLHAHTVGETPVWEAPDVWELHQALSGTRPDVLLVTAGYETASEEPSLHLRMESLLSALLELQDSPLRIWLAASAEGNTALRSAVPPRDFLDVTVLPNATPGPELARTGPLRRQLTALLLERETAAIGNGAARDWGLHDGRLPPLARTFLEFLRQWHARRQPERPLHAVHASGGRRLHVLLTAIPDQHATVWHGSGRAVPAHVLAWPSPTLTSGLPAVEWAPDAVREPKGLLPAVAPLLVEDPAGTWSLLNRDLLEPG